MCSKSSWNVSKLYYELKCLQQHQRRKHFRNFDILFFGFKQVLKFESELHLWPLGVICEFQILATLFNRCYESTNQRQCVCYTPSNIYTPTKTLSTSLSCSFESKRFVINLFDIYVYYQLIHWVFVKSEKHYQCYHQYSFVAKHIQQAIYLISFSLHQHSECFSSENWQIYHLLTEQYPERQQNLIQPPVVFKLFLNGCYSNMLSWFPVFEAIFLQFVQLQQQSVVW